VCQVAALQLLKYNRRCNTANATLFVCAPTNKPAWQCACSAILELGNCFRMSIGVLSPALAAQHHFTRGRRSPSLNATHTMTCLISFMIRRLPHPQAQHQPEQGMDGTFIRCCMEARQDMDSRAVNVLLIPNYASKLSPWKSSICPSAARAHPLLPCPPNCLECRPGQAAASQTGLASKVAASRSGAEVPPGECPWPDKPGPAHPGPSEEPAAAG